MSKRKAPASTQPDLSGIALALHPLAIPLASLMLDAQNARLHDSASVDAIAASLQKFGQQKPVVVQKSSMIVRAGNGTVEAARKLGWTHIAANVAEMTDDQARAFALFDNRTAELSAWDADEVDKLLGSLQLDDELLHQLGEDLLGELFEYSDESEAVQLPPRESPATDRDPNEPPPDQATTSGKPPEPAERKFRIIVECDDEMHQQELLDQFDQEGIKCRSLIA